MDTKEENIYEGGKVISAQCGYCGYEGTPEEVHKHTLKEHLIPSYNMDKSIKEIAIDILKEYGIDAPEYEDIEMAVIVMEDALQDALEDGYFD